MELVVEPDLYSPNIDENGNYIDKIPSFHIIKKGIMCPCGCRKDKVYDSVGVFSAHTKTKAHQKWLTSTGVKVLHLNTNAEATFDLSNMEDPGTIWLNQIDVFIYKVK